MGARIRGLAVLVVVLTVGAFLGSMASQWAEEGRPSRSTGPSGPGRAVTAPEERVRVEVLNGGGVEGMARAATERLREVGFDVVYYGNAAAFDHERSEVVDRVGRPELARSVAKALGVEAYRSDPDTSLYLDVTVVLGSSWTAPTGAPAPEEPTPWWDVRRFLRPDGDSAPVIRGPGKLVDPGG